MVSRLDDDRLLSISAESILVLYVFVGFLEKIHSLLESVLVLDGIVMAFSVAFIFFYFSRKDSFDFSFYPISLFLLTFFILFSSRLSSALSKEYHILRAPSIEFALVPPRQKFSGVPILYRHKNLLQFCARRVILSKLRNK